MNRPPANPDVAALANDVRAVASRIGYGLDDLLADLARELGVRIEFPADGCPMDVESRIVLTLDNPRDGGPWVLHVRHRKSVTDPRLAVAAAAKAFLATPNGQAAAAANDGDFNYGDAANQIPQHILEAHGIHDLTITEAWTDNHDTNFNDA